MKKEYWIISLAFLAGIICANIFGVEQLTSYGILNGYFFDKLSTTTIHYKELVAQIFLVRLKELLILVVLSHLLKKVAVWKCCVLFLIFSLGFLVTASIFNFGWKGMLVVIAVLVPQWVCYGFLLYLLWKGNERVNGVVGSCYHYQDRKKKYGMAAALYIAVLVILTLGVLTESYLNPMILKKILKII